MALLRKLIVFLLLLVSTAGHGQELFVASQKYAVWFGSRLLQTDSLPNAQHLDFMNYVSTPDQFLEFFYLGFSAQYRLRNHWELDVKLFSNDDIFPNSFSVAAQHYLLKNIGFGMGVYGYPVGFRQYLMYHILESDGYFTDSLHIVNTYRDLYDLGIYAGPVFCVNNRWFDAKLKCNIGYSAFLPFIESTFLKKQNSNERKEIVYSSSRTSTVFFFPEFELGINLIKAQKVTFGFQIQGSAFLTKRKIDYKKTTHTWLWEDAVNESVHNPRHRYRKFDVDVGLFLKF